MAKNHYSYEKRQQELKKQKKRQEKLNKKMEKKKEKEGEGFDQDSELQDTEEIVDTAQAAQEDSTDQ